MKIWITRSTAFSIQCGGLERLFVWFRKPRWITEWRSKEKDDTPFDDLSDMNGRLKDGWEVQCSGTTWIDRNYSFGKMFGYNDRDNEGENELSKHVWNELCKHFKNEPFDNWHIIESKGEVKIQDFLLELNIDIKLNGDNK